MEKRRDTATTTQSGWVPGRGLRSPGYLSPFLLSTPGPNAHSRTLPLLAGPRGRGARHSGKEQRDGGWGRGRRGVSPLGIPPRGPKSAASLVPGPGTLCSETQAQERQRGESLATGRVPAAPTHASRWGGSESGAPPERSQCRPVSRRLFLPGPPHGPGGAGQGQAWGAAPGRRAITPRSTWPRKAVSGRAGAAR